MSSPLLSAQWSRQTRHPTTQAAVMCPYMMCDSSPKVYVMYSRPLWSHVKELCAGGVKTESSVRVCSTWQHAPLTVLVLFRYCCYVSCVLSLRPILCLKKNGIYIRRIMCFQKKTTHSDIRICCTNHRDSDAQDMHMYIVMSAHSSLP